MLYYIQDRSMPLRMICTGEDLEKAHMKAHFRLDPKTGKLAHIKDYDDSRHKAEVHATFEAGQKVKVNNPKSKHHGKDATVLHYSDKYDCVRTRVEGEKNTVDFAPHQFDHQKKEAKAAEKKEATPDELRAELAKLQEAVKNPDIRPGTESYATDRIVKIKKLLGESEKKPAEKSGAEKNDAVELDHLKKELASLQDEQKGIDPRPGTGGDAHIEVTNKITEVLGRIREIEGKTAPKTAKPTGPLSVGVIRAMLADGVPSFKSYSPKTKEFIFKRTYFYRMGMDADKMSAGVMDRVTKLGLTPVLGSSEDHWHAWPKESYYEVRLTIKELEGGDAKAPEKAPEPKSTDKAPEKKPESKELFTAEVKAKLADIGSAIKKMPGIETADDPRWNGGFADFQFREDGSGEYFTPRSGEQDDDHPIFTGKMKLEAKVKTGLIAAGLATDVDSLVMDHEKGWFSVRFFPKDKSKPFAPKP